MYEKDRHFQPLSPTLYHFLRILNIKGPKMAKNKDFQGKEIL